MKITFLSPPPNLSGGERVIAEYARKMLERGHHVEILCVEKQPPSLTDRAKAFLRGKPLIASKSDAKSHYADYQLPVRWIKSYSDVPEADAVIATFWPTAHDVAALPPAKGAKIYLVQGDEGALHTSQPAAEQTYVLPMLQVCVSSWVAQQIKKRHPNARQVVINNAVDVARFVRNIDARPDRVGFLYSRAAIKNSSLGIAAMELLCQDFPDLECVSFSDAFPEDFPSWISCVTQPSAPQMSEIYGTCKAWLFPSKSEGFGLPILEAMACATPVVGTPAGAAPELLAQGGGILVDHDDPEAMAAAGRQLLTCPPDEWQAYSDAAYATARSYTWNDATDLLLQSIDAEVRRSRKQLSAGHSRHL